MAVAGCWLVLIAGVAGVMRHRLGGGAAGDRAVVGVAVVGGDPVVGARGGGGVAREVAMPPTSGSRCR